MKRTVNVGGYGGGKTARMKEEMDAWLMAHPYALAHIIDTKTGTVEKR